MSIAGCVQIQFYVQASLSPLGLPGPNGPVQCTGLGAPWSLRVGNYALNWQASDGNLVLYRGKGAEWSAQTNSRGNMICFQGDGNLVIYDINNTPIYSTGTADSAHGGDGGRLLTLYPNGLLEISNQAGASIFHQGPFE